VYPNPAINRGIIDYYLEEDGLVDIAIFDSSGRQLLHLEKGFKEKGAYQSHLVTAQLMNGLYFVKANLGTRTKVVKVYVNKG